MILLWWFYDLRDFKSVFRTCHESQNRKHQQNHDKHTYIYSIDCMAPMGHFVISLPSRGDRHCFSGSLSFLLLSDPQHGTTLDQRLSQRSQQVWPFVASSRSSVWTASHSAALGGTVFRCLHLSQTLQDLWSCAGVRFIVALYLNINHVQVCFGLLFWRSAISKSCLSHHDLPSCLNLPGWQRWQSMNPSDTFR